MVCFSDGYLHHLQRTSYPTVIINMEKSQQKDIAIELNDLSSIENYWNNRYLTDKTGWDLGEVSPPIKYYIDQLENKNIRILIPGSGNSHEAEYLLNKGFTNITIIDIAAVLIEKLKKTYLSNSNITITLGDFFEHHGQYDLIIEQTFFCAILPALRKKYIAKVKELLAINGKLIGVLFDRTFEQEGPPFGGSKSEYISLFENDFTTVYMDDCFNSHPKRLGSELFITLVKK